MRISNKMIEGRIKWLNKMTNNPETPWTRKDGKLKQNKGNFHIDSAYVGVALYQQCESGARDVLRVGHRPKREMYDLINAYMQAIEDIEYKHING